MMSLRYEVSSDSVAESVLLGDLLGEFLNGFCMRVLLGESKSYSSVLLRPDCL